MCVLNGAGQGARPGGNGINYPVNGFPPRGTWVGASAAVGGRRHLCKAWSWQRPVSVLLVPWVSGQFGVFKVSQSFLAPLEAAGFGGNQRGGYLGLPLGPHFILFRFPPGPALLG